MERRRLPGWVYKCAAQCNIDSCIAELHIPDVSALNNTKAVFFLIPTPAPVS